MSPLHRTERSERPVNPVRVVSGTATSRSNSRFAAETPGGASTDLSVPTTGAASDELADLFERGKPCRENPTSAAASKGVARWVEE
jgi:hypothetical protein